MEMRRRVRAAWGNWKKYTGVSSDSEMPEKLKEAKRVVRSELVHSAYIHGQQRKAKKRDLR